MAKKLVRDNYPSLPQPAGKFYSYTKATRQEFIQALSDKIVEEALEVKSAIQKKNKKDIKIELADLKEVLEAIQKNLRIKNSDIMSEKIHKRSKYGGFEKGIMQTEIKNS